MNLASHAIAALISATAVLGLTSAAQASEEDDRRLVAALDTEYQAAVKRNDAQTMERILDERFVLVLGSGKTFVRADLLDSASSGRIRYEQQDEEPGSQTVRLFGDTAVVTALLKLKGVNEGEPFERKLWFSDTYVRTGHGWRYVFGQASLPLP